MEDRYEKEGVQPILSSLPITLIAGNKKSTYLNQVQVISMETNKHTDLR